MVAPVVEPATAAVPLLIPACRPAVYRHPGALSVARTTPAAIKPDVLSYYLNAPSFIVRTAAGAWSAGRRWRCCCRASAGAPASSWPAHGPGVPRADHLAACRSTGICRSKRHSPRRRSAPASRSPRWSAPLALAALRRPMPDDDPAIGDVGGLAARDLLGITYIDFMAVLVIWYGDLPREEIWFVERDRWPWRRWRSALSSSSRWCRSSRCCWRESATPARPLRAVGVCTLIGLACYDAYLIAPPAGGCALVTGAPGRRRHRARIAAACSLSGVDHTLVRRGSRPMPAEEHIQYVPESPGVDTRHRTVVRHSARWCCLAARSAGSSAFTITRVPVKTVPPPQTFPQPRVDTSEADASAAASPARRAEQAAGNLGLGRRPAHTGADPDRARDDNCWCKRATKPMRRCCRRSRR